MLGSCLGYLNFTQVIFRGSNYTEVQFLERSHILIDCSQRSTRATALKAINAYIVMATH